MAEGLAPWMRGGDGAPLEVVPLHTTRQGPEKRNSSKRSQEGSFLQRPVKAQHCAQCEEKCLPTPAHYYSQRGRMNAELRGGTLGDNGPVSQTMLFYSQFLTRSPFCSE